MAQEPGWYRDGRGGRYHWDGHKWDQKDNGPGPFGLNPNERPALPPHRRPDQPDPRPPSGDPGCASAILLAAVVILVVSQLVQSLRWLLLIGFLVGAVASVITSRESRLMWVMVCVASGLGALWGFSLE
ncbi:hypothetical protein AB0J42_00740 [Nonomuraea sp. NPDC049649]|uniref:hypothetical protein n=1 Tax=Nonomuraea sp. NPDC049649 TaxID=3155776 RepID=UPI00343F7416